MFANELLGVYNITDKYDSECITLEILQVWLEGRGRKPVTWEMLVIALHSIGLHDLAEDIHQALPAVASSAPQETTTGTADEPSPTPAPGMNMCCVGH